MQFITTILVSNDLGELWTDDVMAFLIIPAISFVSICPILHLVGFIQNIYRIWRRRRRRRSGVKWVAHSS